MNKRRKIIQRNSNDNENYRIDINKCLTLFTACINNIDIRKIYIIKCDTIEGQLLSELIIDKLSNHE